MISPMLACRIAILRARRPCVRFKLSDIVSRSSMRPSSSILRAFISRSFHKLHASNTLAETHTQTATMTCSRTRPQLIRRLGWNSVSLAYIGPASMTSSRGQSRGAWAVNGAAWARAPCYRPAHRARANNGGTTVLDWDDARCRVANASFEFTRQSHQREPA